MKSIRNLSEFARQNNISPQLAKQKRDNGYVFGVLDGKPVAYNPKSVMFLKGSKINSIQKHCSKYIFGVISDDLQISNSGCRCTEVDKIAVNYIDNGDETNEN